jgi:hypothetical protein
MAVSKRVDIRYEEQAAAGCLQFQRQEKTWIGNGLPLKE